MFSRESWHTVVQDARYAVRQWRRTPTFAAAAVVTLALGIGASTAIFTVVSAVLLGPLPFPDGDRLVRLYEGTASDAVFEGGFSVPDFEDWRDASPTIQAMGLYTAVPSGLTLTEDGGAQRLTTISVSTGFFETMAVPPVEGRWPSVAEEESDPHVIVLSYGFWHRQFGGRRDIVGSTLSFEGVPYRVVGVMPESFRFPSPDADIWALLSRIPAAEIPLSLRPVRFLDAVGRLAPLATPAQAEAELTRIARDLAVTYPDTNAERTGASVVPLREAMVGDVSTALWVLLGVVGFTLLIACVNVANLLLARGTSREREFAVRASLGASRKRLVGQLVTECALLSLLGGALGTALAAGGVKALVSRSAGLLPRASEIHADLGVLLFAATVTLFTGLVFGLAPALRAARSNPAERLRSGARSGGTSASVQRTLSALVVAEVALACVLLVGAGLFLRSLSVLMTVDPGFRAEGALAVDMTISGTRYVETEEFLAFHDELQTRLAALPGVRSVGSIRQFPTRGEGEPVRGYRDAVLPEDPSRPEPATAQLLQVSPGLFRALGISVVDGQVFESESDPLDGVVINETLAREAFGTSEAAGRRLYFGGFELAVMGVVEDVRQDGVSAPAPPALYVHGHAVPRRGMTFVLRTDGPALSLAGPVRSVVQDMDALQPVTAIYPAASALGDSVAVPRFFTTLMGLFASVALTLTVVGIYGVVSYGVRQRIHEIGVRIALGARAMSVVRLVLRRALTPVIAGIAIGLGAALALSGTLRSQLFGVAASDVATYLAVAGTVVAVSLLAVVFPAKRATHIDPIRALAAE